MATGSYPALLGKTLGQFAAATSADETAAAVANFERLTQHPDADWHAHYYYAFGLTIQSFRTVDANDRDELVDLAEEAWEVLAKQEGADQAEVIALEARIGQARISINPADRSMLMGPKLLSKLFQAKATHPNNPRVLLLLAQMVAKTPTAYGGGPTRALPLAQGSTAAFEQPATNPFSPSWGSDEAKKLCRELTEKSKKK